VKKRRKNGDCYWVRANVTPMRDGERITGYRSVRTRADR
jgi:aerotaxis receptor